MVQRQNPESQQGQRVDAVVLDAGLEYGIKVGSNARTQCVCAEGAQGYREKAVQGADQEKNSGHVVNSWELERQFQTGTRKGQAGAWVAAFREVRIDVEAVVDNGASAGEYVFRRC